MDAGGLNGYTGRTTSEASVARRGGGLRCGELLDDRRLGFLRRAATGEGKGMGEAGMEGKSRLLRSAEGWFPCRILALGPLRGSNGSEMRMGWGWARVSRDWELPLSLVRREETDEMESFGRWESQFMAENDKVGLRVDDLGGVSESGGVGGAK